MTRFLTTTALVAAMAMPAFAQSNDGAAQNVEMQQQQMETMGIMASNLIGQRLYMPGHGEMNAGGDMNAEADATMSEGDQSENMAQAGTDSDDPAETNLEAAGEELADAAGEAGQAIENTAEDAGAEIADAANETEQALETAGDNIASEITEVPENWNMVADIEDVVITQGGEVRALIVDAGGFLGFGETERRIDIENVRFVSDGDDEGEYFVVFTGDRALFEEQGRYDEAQAAARGEMRATEDPATRQQLAEMENRNQSERVKWADVTTDELLGAAVYGENDDWIGDLSELALAEDGKIDGVIIDVGGFLGLGEKAVMLTMDEVALQRVRGDEIRAYVNATEEDLESRKTWSGNEM